VDQIEIWDLRIKHHVLLLDSCNFTYAEPMKPQEVKQWITVELFIETPLPIRVV
jgi:hypothetical protein